jgi:FMN-dependent NADH-azoreductase
MKNILHIISSTRGNASVSVQLGRAIVERVKASNPGSSVKEINLSAQPFPHLDDDFINILRRPQEHRTAEDIEVLMQSDNAVQQVLEADIIVIGVPLINFGIPSTLKSWLDNIVRAGITFSYGENGPKGLLSGKKVYIALASGGIYSKGPMQAYDHATPYLNNVLNFIGLKDITILRAEGTAMPAMQDIALEKAVNSIMV